MKNLWHYNSVIIITLFTTFSVQAAPITSTFSTGDTLTADKMTEIKDAVNDNDTRTTTNEVAIGAAAVGISTNTGNITANSTDIGTNTSDITINTSDISVNVTDISINTSDIDINTLDISDHETRISNLETPSNLVVLDNADMGTGSESYTGISTYEFLRLVSTYTKVSATSTLLISYSDSLQTDNANGACSIAVRVNDTAPDGGAFAAPGYSTYLTTQTFFSSTGTFSGLPAGTHDINLYKRVLSLANCIRNNGNWNPTITIIEIEP